MSYTDAASGERNAVALKMAHTRQDWHDKRKAVDAVMNDIGGLVTRVGDQSIGGMWFFDDGKVLLCEIDPRFGDNIERRIQEALDHDPSHVKQTAGLSDRVTGRSNKERAA